MIDAKRVPERSRTSIGDLRFGMHLHRWARTLLAVATSMLAVGSTVAQVGVADRAPVDPAGLIAFGGLYIVACVFMLPGAILTLGAGALFGLVKGTLLVSLSSTAGATAAFLVGRYLARAMVARRVAGRAGFQAIDEAVAAEGWKIVGLTRLSPVFPFNVLNYAFGLTRVSLREYVLASWIGMMPGTVMYVYIGSLARLGVDAAEASTAQTALRIVGLIATIVVTVFITRIAKKALAQKVDQDTPTLNPEVPA